MQCIICEEAFGDRSPAILVQPNQSTAKLGSPPVYNRYLQITKRNVCQGRHRAIDAWPMVRSVSAASSRRAQVALRSQMHLPP
jgi:hypothetical protein